MRGHRPGGALLRPHSLDAAGPSTSLRPAWPVNHVPIALLTRRPPAPAPYPVCTGVPPTHHLLPAFVLSDLSISKPVKTYYQRTDRNQIWSLAGLYFISGDEQIIYTDRSERKERGKNGGREGGKRGKREDEMWRNAQPPKVHKQAALSNRPLKVL